MKDIRRGFPSPEDLPDEEGCKELWETLRSSACRPVRPTRSTTAESVLFEIINGQDTPHVQTDEHSGATETEIAPTAAPCQTGLAELRARIAQELRPQRPTRYDTEIARVSEELQTMLTQISDLQSILHAIPTSLVEQCTQGQTGSGTSLSSPLASGTAPQATTHEISQIPP